MCPKPGMMLRITATASLALPSAVSVSPRFQSHRSQRCASFGRRCPQYGHGILSPVLDSGLAAGASVYSTFISTSDGHNTRGIRQATEVRKMQPRITRIPRIKLVWRLVRSRPAHSPFGLPVYVARRPPAPSCETPFLFGRRTDALQLCCAFRAYLL